MENRRADTMLAYSATGGGKTTEIARAAEWVWKNWKKRTRLISSDSGWGPAAHLIRSEANPSGIIDAVNTQHLDEPLIFYIKLSEGYWPKTSDSGEPVMTAPGRYLMKPPSADPGELGKQFGLYAIEGLKTIADALLMDHIRKQRKLKDVSISEFSLTIPVEKEVGGKTQVVQETEKFGMADRTHYLHVQNYILLDLVPRFSALQVPLVIWTSHEAMGEDDIVEKTNRLGPATVGKAAVGFTAQKFGDTLHLDRVTMDKMVKGPNGLTPMLDPQTKTVVKEIFRRAYYEEHADDVLKTMRWPAKISIPLDRVEEFQGKFPGSYIPLDVKGGLDKFLDFKYSQNGQGPK